MTLAEANILVVDDEPELLEIFGIWLKREGATVHPAPNGEAALKLLETQKVDALVSDIRMPVMDGVTLVKTLFGTGRSIPTTIFVSGFGEISPRLLYSLGVEALLSKPLPRNCLVQTLARSLRDREELWSEAPKSEVDKEVTVEFSSLEDALQERSFVLGRGGCCFRSSRLVNESTVNLSFRFALDALTLTGQGIVRWHDSKSQRSGVEFTSLDSGSRRWVAAQLRSSAPLSFIPSCE